MNKAEVRTPGPVTTLDWSTPQRSVICCGSGGVGKTTTAAAIAMEAARRGRRAAVVTIDPPRRLAEAMGLSEGLSNEPDPWSPASWPGASCGR